MLLTIGIIATCYAFAFYLIQNNPTLPEKKLTSQTKEKDTDYTIANQTNENQISQYRGNQLATGSSPFESCFGKGKFKGNATLTIKNGASSDAIVCLYNIKLDKTIRNIYVQKNTNFKMEKIAQGNYKIKVFYGNDWNPELENPCGQKGYFESDLNFSEFDDIEYFEDNNKGYTIATVTLYSVTNGNATSSEISPLDFFRK